MTRLKRVCLFSFFILAVIALGGPAWAQVQPPRRFAELDAGLPETLMNLQLSTDRNYFVILKKAPQFPFDFRSPEHMRKTLPFMDAANMDIGHVMLAWQCRDLSGRLHSGATGQTGEDLHQSEKMLRSGWGLSTLMATFTDGHLNTPEQVESEIGEASEDGRLRFLAIEVGAEECDRMLSFLRRYADGPENAQTHFGLNLRPALFEGGGCGSFVVTLLEKAGLFKTLLPLVWRTLSLPAHLMGAGTELPPATDVLAVNPKSQNVHMMWLGLSTWDQRRNGPAGPSLRLVDPEMLIHLMTSLEIAAARRLGSTQPDLSAEMLDLAGKVRTVKALAVPVAEAQATNFTLETINEKFDDQTAKLQSLADGFLGHYIQGGGQIRAGQLFFTTGLILEKGSGR